ncbi:hypothetical protein BKI52_42945 [marine bacterium AO1-C]|nr:hypothetical protein BKI52_42945 [marine bacterium AO1-C]
MRVFFKNTFFVFFFFGITYTSFAQKVHLDSVRQALFSTRNDTVRAVLSMDYALTLVKLDGTTAQVVDYTNAAFYYAKIGVSIARRLKHPATLATVYTFMGKIHENAKGGDYAKAVENYDKALEYYGEKQDSLQQADILLHLANFYYKFHYLNSNYYDKAFETAEKVTKILEVFYKKGKLSDQWLVRYSDMHEVLGDLKARLGKDDQKILNSYEKSHTIRSSIADDKLKGKSLKYDYMLKFRDSQKRAADQRLWAAVIGLGLIFIFVLVMLRGFVLLRKQRNSLQEKNIKIEQMNKEIKHRNEEVMAQSEQIQKANEVINAEKEKSDKLLLNILPSDIAEELKTNGKSQVRNYDMASVLFTDFKGFTKIASVTDPADIVKDLDTCFAAFDRIIEQFGLEKIKTIGDAYMCVGGIPIDNKTNAIDSVLAALEIRRFMAEFRAEKIMRGEQAWELRLGINTGPLIAGVIGTKKFAYDVWGDTVNTASRMESNGVVNEISISQETFELVSDFFVCEYHGKIQAKGKGEIDMYLVKSILPELSEDYEGVKPGQLFKDKMSEQGLIDV